MEDTYKFPLLTIALRHERHVVQARQRARELAAQLGFEHQDQIRLATAASELARNAFRYAGNGDVDFSIRHSSPQMFIISVADRGAGIPHLQDIMDGRYVSKTGLGMGLIGTKRLMDHFHIESSSKGTHVEFGKAIPESVTAINSSNVKTISSKLMNEASAGPFEEIDRQNRELLRTLAELKEKQDLLTNLNQELEDTNRGVVALYAELEQHADDLRRVSDLKTSFLSNLSHEFRTPLNSILSLSRLLLARMDGDLSSEQETQVTFIQQSASQLAELVNDLLDLAKVEAGRIDVKAKYFEVNDLFGALRGMLKPLLAGNSLELIFEAAPEIPTLYTDEGKLSQVLRNLIANALKFTRRGHIRVTAETKPDGWVVFRVADTGIGIAPEDQEKIFEEFVQIESDLQSQVKGTGLGLPLSRRLADLLGGMISVESAVGEGSTFTVQIPAYLTKPIDDGLRGLLNSEINGTVVLFIEDNRETSFVHEAALKNSDYVALSVANLADARIALKIKKPALVVLDRLIDQADALFFIKEMRDEGYTVPVLVVSVVDDEKAAIHAGAAAFLAKPIPPFTLLNAVRELIEGKVSKTVLVVDDDEVTCYLVGGVLIKAGYRVLEAHSGRDALRLIKADIPYAVVLDITMPDMNGFEVLREVRALPSAASVPVIVHSSKDLSAQERKLLFDAKALIYPKQAFSGTEGPSGLVHLLERSGMEAR